MIRNIKALGLAFVAVVAMSMAASGAQGSELHISSPGAAHITGEQTTQHKFQVTHPNGPSVTCNDARFETSTLSAKTPQEATITGQYTFCQGFGQNASVNMNGCKYTITGAGKAANTAQVDVVGCTSGKQIEINTAVCQLRVPEQSTIGGHLTFQDGGGPTADINVAVGASGIRHQFHGVLCGHTVNVTTADGTYQGSATVKAFTVGKPETITHNGHQFHEKQTQGVQVAVTTT